MLVKWNSDKHSINIPDIDNQHQELFVIVNDLYNLRTHNSSNNDIIKLLKRLYAYTSYHFLSEERLFKEHAYPAAKGHIEMHNRFRRDVKEYLNEVREKPNTDLAPLQDFLVEWILDHITGADRRYSEYFAENGIVPDVHLSSKNRTAAAELWEEQQLSLEIREIDSQHKELINILQQANDLNFANEKRVYSFIPGIIKKMYYYSQFHFSYEEEHMAKNDYPALQEHQNWHRTFFSETKTFADKYNNGKSVELVGEIVFFLKDWTINHILTEDKKYKDYLISSKKDIG